MSHYKSILLFLSYASFVFGNNQTCVDINFTSYSGAENILSIQRAVEKIDNIILPSPPLLSSQDLRIIRSPLSDRMIAAAKSILFWLPFNATSIVTQHEVFGHGYRIRDLGTKYAKVIGYKIYVFAGMTNFDITNKLTVSQLLAINVAGLEADSILAHKTKINWLNNGRIEPRQALLYIQSSMSLTGYAMTVHSNATTVPKSGNDIVNFLFELNSLYKDSYLSYQTLRNISFINFIDPFFFYSMLAQMCYITYGSDIRIPMFKVGSIRYLPSLKLSITPFGMQGYVENFFVFKSVPTYLYVKWGKNGANIYYGLGIENAKIFNWKTGSLGFRGDIWRQPSVLFQQGTLSALQLVDLPSGTPVTEIPELYSRSLLTKQNLGGAFSLIGTFGRLKWPARLYLELGYKSDGYLPGEALRASPIARGGLSGEF